jgi:hypothetical protein
MSVYVVLWDGRVDLLIWRISDTYNNFFENLVAG